MLEDGERWRVVLGDCMATMAALPAESVDAVVTDPPYGLSEHNPTEVLACLSAWCRGEEYQPTGRGFMGKSWDAWVPGPAYWREALRVLKPGGHLLAFAGSRTQDLMGMALRLAGFEIRDCIMWVFGCLSEDTDILVDGQWVPYHMAIEGRLALCYDVASDTFSQQPIEQLFIYDYDDTAYRIESERTDQIVSRSHRCIVWRGDRWVFAPAEEVARQQTARVPVLEDLPSLLDEFSMPHKGAGAEEQDLLAKVCGGTHAGAATAQADGRAHDDAHNLPGVFQGNLEAERLGSQERAGVLQSVLPGNSCDGRDSRGAQVRPDGDAIPRHRAQGGEEPGVEGWGDVLPQARELQANQVRPVPAGLHAHGAPGRLRDGASAPRGAGDGALPPADGGSAPHGPRPGEQRTGEPGGARVESGSQAVRASRFTTSDLARVTPFHLTGKVWCVKVPTGAFVARRNGKVFITGNSGFPKSLDISKAIDKAAGAEREVVGVGKGRTGAAAQPHGASFSDDAYQWPGEFKVTAPATPEAAQWAGWGTALKPAYEPIILARKPLGSTVAACVLEYGTGGLNINGCRVEPTGESRPRAGEASQERRYADAGATNFAAKPGVRGGAAEGRWPANIIHDGSPEVVAGFPQTTSGKPAQGGHARRGSLHDTAGGWGMRHDTDAGLLYGDSGSAARFFYCAKAGRDDRDDGLDGFDLRPSYMVENGSKTAAAANGVRYDRTTRQRNSHPTVKPVALMRWLVRLITPPGGIVLDPFCGSGSTGKAALLESLRFIGCELQAEYAAIARARCDKAATSEPGPDQLDLFESAGG